jgi:hypothetical protein
MSKSVLAILIGVLALVCWFMTLLAISNINAGNSIQAAITLGVMSLMLTSVSISLLVSHIRSMHKSKMKVVPQTQTSAETQ